MSLLPVIYADELAKPIPPRRGPWGGWHLKQDVLALELRDDDGGFLCEVDLEKCTTAAAVLHQIYRVRDKGNLPLEALGDLVRALDDTLQVHNALGSPGAERTLKPEEIAHLARWTLSPESNGLPQPRPGCRPGLMSGKSPFSDLSPSLALMR